MCVHMLINAGKDHVTKSDHHIWGNSCLQIILEESTVDVTKWDNMAKEEQTSSLKLI